MGFFLFSQVPFIAFYRKEHIEPDLKINDLWKIWQWDEKVFAYI
jgi:transcription elongation factor SPT6